MRELKTKDIFTMSAILQKVGVKVEAEVEQVVDGEKVLVAKTQTQMGAEMILALGENLHKAEKEVNAMLADLAGVPADEFADLPLSQAYDIMQEFKELPGVKDFFTQAASSTDTKSAT